MEQYIHQTLTHRYLRLEFIIQHCGCGLTTRLVIIISTY